MHKLDKIVAFYHANPWPAVAIFAILAFVFIKIWERAPFWAFILTWIILGFMFI